MLFFFLSHILQLGVRVYNVKHNVTLQALHCVIAYVPLASQTLFTKQCALCPSKSLLVTDSKVFYLMQKMVIVVKCSILQGKGEKNPST